MKGNCFFGKYSHEPAGRTKTFVPVTAGLSTTNLLRRHNFVTYRDGEGVLSKASKSFDILANPQKQLGFKKAAVHSLLRAQRSLCAIASSKLKLTAKATHSSNLSKVCRQMWKRWSNATRDIVHFGGKLRRGIMHHEAPIFWSRILHFNPGNLISKLLIFINFKNSRTLRKQNRLRKFPGFNTVSDTFWAEFDGLIFHSPLLYPIYHYSRYALDRAIFWMSFWGFDFDFCQSYHNTR